MTALASFGVQEEISKDTWRLLESGIAYRTANRETLVVGSIAEGLTFKGGFGHGPSDIDILEFYGGGVGVHMPRNAPEDLQRGTLVYQQDQLPTPYCRLLVNREDEAVEGIAGMGRRMSLSEAQTCIKSNNDGIWLSSIDLISTQQIDAENISGPAGQTEGGKVEYVSTLVASHPPACMETYLERERSGPWPSVTTLDRISKLPTLCVMVGHKGSIAVDREFRMSSSLPEVMILRDLQTSVRQAYSAFKYAFKRGIGRRRENKKDGRAKIGSYHLKTTILHSLERNPDVFSRDQLPFDMVLHLSEAFSIYLEDGKLPNYFDSRSDLLERVEPEELGHAKTTIQEMLENPIKSIVFSSLHPEEIYGSDVNGDELLSLFQRMESNPVCSWEDLDQKAKDLITRIDHHRSEKFATQQHLDHIKNVSGRESLTSLQDILTIWNVHAYSHTVWGMAYLDGLLQAL